MKVFSVLGFSHTGKTTTIEAVIKELRKRNYTVGTVKSIHHVFSMDTKGKNTHRHKEAGAELVTARGQIETAVMWPGRMDIYKLLQLYDQDYVILEGDNGANVPTLITADSIEGIDAKLDGRTFMISGKIADEIDEYKGYKAISALSDVDKIVDHIEETVFELLPDFSEKCCSLCGYNCRTMCEMILKGEKTREDCLLRSENLKLRVDGKEIKMVPFVQNILSNTLHGLVGELDGYRKDAHIELEFGVNYNKE